MGILQKTCLDLASNPFWIQFLEAQSKITSPERKNKSKRSRKSIMKRRERNYRRSSSSRSGRNDEVVKKVEILKKLVPNCESTRMEKLFQETADYIIALEMRVKVMQTMVNVLQIGSDEEY